MYAKRVLTKKFINKQTGGSGFPKFSKKDAQSFLSNLDDKKDTGTDTTKKSLDFAPPVDILQSYYHLNAPPIQTFGEYVCVKRDFVNGMKTLVEELFIPESITSNTTSSTTNTDINSLMNSDIAKKFNVGGMKAKLNLK